MGTVVHERSCSKSDTSKQSFDGILLEFATCHISNNTSKNANSGSSNILFKM